MRLFIAEKPELAKAIAKGLGGGKPCKGYINCSDNNIVTFCFGHMLELFEPEDYDKKYSLWNLTDLPIVEIPWKKKVPKDREEQFQIISELITKSDTVVSAGDADAEGEYLIREILDYVGYKRNRF